MDAETGRRSCGLRVLGARSTLARSLPSTSSAKHERLWPVSFLDVSILANLLGAARPRVNAWLPAAAMLGRNVKSVPAGRAWGAVDLNGAWLPVASPLNDTGRRSRDLRVLGARSTLARSLPSRSSAKHERLRPVSFFEVIILVSV